MQEQRVNKTQAIRLKNAGFDWRIDSYYDLELQSDKPINCSSPSNWNLNKWAASAPAISYVTRWLREVKGWHVSTDVESGFWRTTGTRIETNKGPNVFGTAFSYPTHDEAILVGIDMALNIIEKEVANG